MKRKIVIQVPLHCDNCRNKALKIASVAKGRVDSVALEGGDRDQVVVIGEDVDSACLAKVLRKKFGHATIVTVEEVKKKEPTKKEEVKPKTIELPICAYPCYPGPYYYNHCPHYVVCEEPGPCSVM